MSTTYSLQCDRCCIRLDIGQSAHTSRSPGFIWTGNEDTVVWLNAFLFSCLDHPMRFVDEHCIDRWDEDYQELETDEQYRCSECDCQASLSDEPPHRHFSLKVRPWTLREHVMHKDGPTAHTYLCGAPVFSGTEPQDEIVKGCPACYATDAA